MVQQGEEARKREIRLEKRRERYKNKIKISPIILDCYYIAYIYTSETGSSIKHDVRLRKQPYKEYSSAKKVLRALYYKDHRFFIMSGKEATEWGLKQALVGIRRRKSRFYIYKPSQKLEYNPIFFRDHPLLIKNKWDREKYFKEIKKAIKWDEENKRGLEKLTYRRKNLLKTSIGKQQKKNT